MRNSVGSPNGRAMKSTPTGSRAATGPTSRVSLPTGSRSHTAVVKPAGTSITGNPCCPNIDQPIAVRPLRAGSRGDRKLSVAAPSTSAPPARRVSAPPCSSPAASAGRSACACAPTYPAPVAPFGLFARGAPVREVRIVVEGRLRNQIGIGLDVRVAPLPQIAVDHVLVFALSADSAAERAQRQGFRHPSGIGAHLHQRGDLIALRLPRPRPQETAADTDAQTPTDQQLRRRAGRCTAGTARLPALDRRPWRRASSAPRSRVRSDRRSRCRPGRAACG